jgi:glc operon protein GlcG
MTLNKSNSRILTGLSTLVLVAGLSAPAYAISMKPTLQDQDVQKIVDAALRAMDEQHTKGCIAVADASGELLYLQRQEGAVPNCVSAALAKVRTAAKFQTATETFRQLLVKGDNTMLAVPELTPLPGGVPLLSGDTVVGAVAISTADGSLDLKVVEAAAAALK